MVNPLDIMVLDAPAPSVSKQVLHVGCGAYHPDKLHKSFAGWKEIRLDIDPEVKPDIVASLTDMSVVAGDSMDAVYSSHNVEHLYAHEVPKALAEFRRVLKMEGVALITLPDLQKVCEYVVADRLEDQMYMSPAGPIAALDTLYGLRSAMAGGHLFMAHRTGFTARTLGTALARAGFSEVRVQRSGFDLWALAKKGAQPATTFQLIADPQPLPPPQPAPVG